MLFLMRLERRYKEKTHEIQMYANLQHLTVTQLPCCTGSTSAGTEQCTEFTKLVASKAVSKTLALLQLTLILNVSTQTVDGRRKKNTM